MELSSAQKLSKHIFRLLKVNEISFPIGRTNKGNLTIVFNESKDDFDLFLDSVPLPTKSLLEDDKNIELKQMVEKYWFHDKNEVSNVRLYPTDFPKLNIEDMDVDNGTTIVTIPEENIKRSTFATLTPKKSRGRPAGSKNVAKK